MASGPERIYRSLMERDRIVGAFCRRDGVERIIVVEREDGLCTYKKQYADRDGVWGDPGPGSGVYQSSDTAIAEARQRDWWLKASIPDVS